MMKKRFFAVFLSLMTVLSFTTVAFAEEGTLNGNYYTFKDRSGNTISVPVNAFASKVIDFKPGDPWRAPGESNTDPKIAIGLPDATDSNSSTGDLCLGGGGVLVLGFDCAIFDGNGNDIYVFEVGSDVEDTKVEVSENLSTWYYVGVATGSTAGVDMSGKVPEGARIRYVRLTDLRAHADGYWPGADIDTVCGIKTMAVKSPFRDVNPGDYCYDAVLWAINHAPQITTGTTSTTFSPRDTVTRGQAVTFLWRTMGEPNPSTTYCPFTDVKASDYYYKAVLWAVGEGITNGTSKTTFSPNSSVTKGQMVTFLYRTIGEPGKTGSGAWYSDAENWARKNGLTTGTDTVYGTDRNCPRGDVVYYLWTALA